MHFITRKVYPKLIRTFNSKLTRLIFRKAGCARTLLKGRFSSFISLEILGLQVMDTRSPFLKEHVSFRAEFSLLEECSWRNPKDPVEIDATAVAFRGMPFGIVSPTPSSAKFPCRLPEPSGAQKCSKVKHCETIDDSGEVWKAFQRVHNKKSHCRIFIICFVVAK